MKRLRDLIEDLLDRLTGGDPLPLAWGMGFMCAGLLISVLLQLGAMRQQLDKIQEAVENLPGYVQQSGEVQPSQGTVLPSRAPSLGRDSRGE